MISLRDAVIFVSGVEFFHTLDHILIALFVSLPIDLKFILLTSALNKWGIIVNGIITIVLLWWAKRLAK